jgi:hypothetical protein
MIYRRDITFISAHLFPVGIVSVVSGVIAAVTGDVLAGMIDGDAHLVWTAVSPSKANL